MSRSEGRSFDEALAYWSDPASYIAYLDDGAGQVRSPAEVFYLERGVDLWQRYVDEGRRNLEAKLFRMLAEGSLLSSATDEVPDPRAPRFLVHPSLYAVEGVAYDPTRGVVVVGERTLWNLAIFEKGEILRSVSEIPEWLSRYSDQHGAGAVPSEKDLASRLADFQHDPDYRHVTLRGREFALTPKQAEIVQVLLDASIKGHPRMHIGRLSEAANFGTPKMSNLFRRLEGWHELIRSDRRGFYWLNL